MSPEDGRASGMDAMLDAVRKVIFPEGALCTSWVVVTEWVDLDGHYWTYVARDDNGPPWRHAGLLAHVLDEGLDRDDEYDEDDD
jgi:hypothetical protein